MYKFLVKIRQDRAVLGINISPILSLIRKFYYLSWFFKLNMNMVIFKKHRVIKYYLLGEHFGLFAIINNLIRTYIYAQDNECAFSISDIESKLYFSKGFSYYFEPIGINYDDNFKIKFFHTILGKINIALRPPIYTKWLQKRFKEEISFDRNRLVVNDIIKHTPHIKAKINQIIGDLNLPDSYVAIHIRRGDKIIYKEANKYEVDEYLGKLKINKTKVIFIMTDDYKAVLEIEHYIQSNLLNIKIYTLCPQSVTGAAAHAMSAANETYSSNEIIGLLAEVEIAKNSECFIGTMSSELGHYIKLIHKNPNNCISLDWDWQLA